jgi:cytosine/adenosine deaminase-related metal-dependent hydrolase
LDVAGAGIVAGASADFFSLRTDAPMLAGRRGDALLDTLIFAGGRECIDSVWCAGRQRVANGRHHARDNVARLYRAALERVLAQD